MELHTVEVVKVVTETTVFEIASESPNAALETFARFTADVRNTHQVAFEVDEEETTRVRSRMFVSESYLDGLSNYKEIK